MALIVGKEIKSLKNGRWVEFDGSKFLIMHTSNLKFQRTIQRLQAPYRKKIDEGKCDPEVLKGIMCEAIAQAILVDWKDVKDVEGANIPFSIEIAKTALVGDDDFREFIQTSAADFSAYKQEESADAGNV